MTTTKPPIRRKSKYPYVASLTDLVKGTLPLIKEAGKADTFLRLIDQAVDSIVGDSEIAKSLKEVEPGGVTMRGITMRPYLKGPAIINCYVFWNDTYECWHVLVESPSEGDGTNPCAHWDKEFQGRTRKEDFWKWN